MLERKIQAKLLQYIDFFPAVGLIGPRQVGKTTLSQGIARLLPRPVQYFDLERADDYDRLQQDAEFIVEQYADHTVIIDEVQRLPQLFAELRGIIDRNRVPGRFLLLGSASPLLLRATSDSLAGRIGYLTLSPLGLPEIPDAEKMFPQHWVRGGFPDSFLAPSEFLSYEWRENFIRTYVERDLQVLGLNTDSVRMRTFLQILASTSGNLWNAEGMGRNLGVTGNTVKSYLHYLESSFSVRLLHPFFINISKRLVKSPKVYFTDTGLMHALLGIRSREDLQKSPFVGGSWETYVVNQIITALPEGLDAFFYRTADGTECDLVLVRGITPVSCIEIKYANNPSVSKGFYNAIETLGCRQNFILTYDSEEYNFKSGVRVMSVSSFVANIPTAKWF